MKKTSASLTSLCFVFAFFFLEVSTAMEAIAEDAMEKTVVLVNDTAITEGDVIRRLRTLYGNKDESDTDPARWKVMRQSALDAEVMDVLLLGAAKESGFEASSDEVDEMISRSRELLGEEKFAEMLTSRNATENDYKELMRRKILVGKFKSELFKDIEIEDTTLLKYFEEHQDSFTVQETVLLEMMVVDSMEIANEIYGKLLEGKGSITEMATQYSASKAGKLQWMPNDALPTNIQPIVKDTAVGKILKPIETTDGVYIIKILDRRSAGKLGFQEAKDKVMDHLLREKQDEIILDWYKAAREKAKIEYIR